MKPLTKKSKKIIIVTSTFGAIALAITIIAPTAYVLSPKYGTRVLLPIYYELDKPETWPYLTLGTGKYMFGNLRNYFIHQNTLSLLSLKKIKAIDSDTFVGVSKNDLEQIQSIIMPEQEINFRLDILDKKNALNYLPNLQNIYVSKNQNLSQYKEIGFSEKIKFWN